MTEPPWVFGPLQSYRTVLYIGRSPPSMVIGPPPTRLSYRTISASPTKRGYRTIHALCYRTMTCVTRKTYYRTKSILSLSLDIVYNISYNGIGQTTTTNERKDNGLSDVTQQCSRMDFFGRYQDDVDTRIGPSYRSYQRHPNLSRTLQGPISWMYPLVYDNKERAITMNMTLLKYRTPKSDHNAFALVPTIWLSDLTHWLKLWDCTILSTSHNQTGAPIIPMAWPSYRTCMDCVKISDLLAMAR